MRMTPTGLSDSTTISERDVCASIRRRATEIGSSGVIVSIDVTMMSPIDDEVMLSITVFPSTQYRAARANVALVSCVADMRQPRSLRNQRARIGKCRI
jgi:hypothetical protein